MDVRRIGMLLITCLLVSCAANPTVSVIRIALLAPFEGRYREIGYDLLYATRMALKDAGYPDIELLPVDDGNTLQDAIDRAEALALNPLVKAALVAGYDASSPEVQAAFADVPVIVIGHWSTKPQDDNVFMLASPELDTLMTTSGKVDVVDAAEIEAPVIGGEVFALKQFPKLRVSLDGITVVSSAALPDAVFTERYLNSDLFVQPPGLLVTLCYDAARMAADAVSNDVNRDEVTQRLTMMQYTGLNGLIRFENGYWVDAPIIRYQYNEDGQLKPLQILPTSLSNESLNLHGYIYIN